MKGAVFFAFLLLLLHPSALPADAGGEITSLLRVPIPRELELCGEKVPLHREDVVERLDIELMVALANPVSTSLWFKRGARHLPMIEEKIRESGLPSDLRYVPVVESNLRAEATSTARAVGPWQFVRSTGEVYGLRRSSWRDDRRHWEEATDAALRHLKDLHDEFGTWSLALAAYNAGRRRVAGAMEGQGERDFYGLALPRETERYVFRIMAAKLILERPEEYGISLEGARLYAPEPTAEARVEVTRSRLPLSAVAGAAGVSFRQLRGLNAWIVGEALPKGTHTLLIPARSRESFHRELDRWEAANPEPEFVYYRVRRGDTLLAIAKRHGVQLADLLAWNSLKDRNVIRPGQLLAIGRND